MGGGKNLGGKTPTKKVGEKFLKPLFPNIQPFRGQGGWNRGKKPFIPKIFEKHLFPLTKEEPQ